MAARQSVTQGAAVAMRYRAATDAILTREHKAASRAINVSSMVDLFTSPDNDLCMCDVIARIHNSILIFFVWIDVCRMHLR